jgi:hypothetical protein
MTSADNGHVAYIRAFTPQTIELKLNEAVASAQDYAMQEGRHGVKAIRHEPTAFTVAVSQDVEYGRTIEHDEFRAEWLPR